MRHNRKRRPAQSEALRVLTGTYAQLIRESGLPSRQGPDGRRARERGDTPCLHDALAWRCSTSVSPAGFDIAPWANRVQLVDAKYVGDWDLPALGAVTAPTALLIRPDGYVAWVGGPDLALGSLTRSPPGSGRLLRPNCTSEWRRRTAARPRDGHPLCWRQRGVDNIRPADRSSPRTGKNEPPKGGR